jgi:hypothetical protein
VSLLLPTPVGGITGVPHHGWPVFEIVSLTLFAQAGLEPQS